MPSTPSGYSLPPVYQAVPGTTIRAEQHNVPLEDLAQAVNDSVARDGSRPMTANLPMAGRRVTGLGNGIATTDAVNLGQLNSASSGATIAISQLNNRFANLISSLTTAMNAACPVGMVAWHNGVSGTIPPGWIPANGQALTRSGNASLWAWAAAQDPATELAWQGSVMERVRYSLGDGSTTFRVPDLNGAQVGSLQGLFLRGSAAGQIQRAQGDAIRNIVGNFRCWGMEDRGVAFDGALFKSGTSSVNFAGGSGQPAVVLGFDASRVVPTATENRPISAIGVWIIRASAFSFAGI